MPLVTHPDKQRTVHVGGRVRPRPHNLKLRLANYLSAALPAPPPAFHELNWQARQAIRCMYLSNALGDSVVASAARMIGVWTGRAKLQGYDSETRFSDDEIRVAYHNFSGGRFPEEDSGCDMEYALNFWTVHGFQPGGANPHKILCWVAVDATNRQEVETAIWLFGAVMSGVEMPDAWINPPPAGDGFVFDVAGAPDPCNGHCMTHFTYGQFDDKAGVGCATWGMYGAVAWEALARYMAPAAHGALYAVVSEDALVKATQKAPNGFAAAELVADARAIGHAR